MRAVLLNKVGGGVAVLRQGLNQNFSDNELIDWAERIKTNYSINVQNGLDGYFEIESYRIIEESDLPDRYFFGAYTDNGNSIDIDMIKARDIHLDNLRVLRNAKLESLDVDYMRADEAGDSTLKESIASLKQQLRDMPETFDLTTATTTADLKALRPDYL